MDNISKLLDPAGAADYLRSRHGRRCSAAYLGKLRCIGGGPLFYKRMGLITYRPSDLDDWVEQVPLDGPYLRTSTRVSI